MTRLLALLLILIAVPAAAQDVHSFCNNGGSGFNAWSPCPGAGSGAPVYTKPGSMSSAGAQQNALAISTNTQLTVPSGAVCAYLTVETANIRRTSDGTSASSSNGSLLVAGAQWSDCGPLASYKFTAVSGSPTITAEYFK